jgi:hypothetical protein
MTYIAVNGQLVAAAQPLSIREDLEQGLAAPFAET